MEQRNGASLSIVWNYMQWKWICHKDKFERQQRCWTGIWCIFLSPWWFQGDQGFYYYQAILGQAFLKLERMDLSGNSIAGHADLLFPVSMSYVTLRHNQFTSAGFKRFYAAYETLEVVDLRNNNISQVAMNIFHNIPPNLHELILSNNVIEQALTESMAVLLSVRKQKRLQGGRWFTLRINWR